METMRTGSLAALPAALARQRGEGDPREEDLVYRTPPASIEAEQALLGAILVNNEAASRVSGFLRPEHFFETLHGRIYDAAITLIERQQLANPITLKPPFAEDEAMAEVGGTQYLVRLAANAATVINAREYGRIIYNMALRRELIHVGEDIVNRAYDRGVDDDPTTQIESAEEQLFHLAEEGREEGGFQAFPATLQTAILVAEAAFKRDGRLSGVATGFTDLDKLLGGLHASDLVILAARPSMGKSSLAKNIALHAAKALRQEPDEDGALRATDGAVVGFFALEMSAEQLATWMLSEESNLDSDRIRKGQLSHDDFSALVLASQRLEGLKLFIDDTPALSIAALRTRARRLKRTHGLGLVIVDYLQLLRPSGNQRYENRVLEISEITQGLKALAKELDVPVLALSQLSRAVENREDKRPQLADLRESGTIEQDADVVMFIYREEYYVARTEPRMATPEHAEWQEKMNRVHGLAEVLVAKQRHGPTGKVQLSYQANLTKFGNFVANDHLPDAPL